MSSSSSIEPTDLVQSIVSSIDSFEPDGILDKILPVRDEPYTLIAIQERLGDIDSAVQKIQHEENEKFDHSLDGEIIKKIHELYSGLHTTQLDFMKLQCDVAFSKEHAERARSICDNSTVREHLDLSIQEKQLEESLRRLRFKPLESFFNKLTEYLESLVANHRKLCLIQSSNYQQLFDWSLYHQSIELLVTCGRTMKDVEFFEKLFLSDLEIVQLRSRPLLDQLELSGFVKIGDDLSLGSKVELVVGKDDLKTYTDLYRQEDLISKLSNNQIKFDLFEGTMNRLKSVTVDCCSLVLDLHIYYIEAHFTFGVNIDRLNGTDNGGVPPPEEKDVPLYAFSPQDYMTQIGHHLLTLRKQTEQYNNHGNDLLMYSYRQFSTLREAQVDIESAKNITEVVMKFIARHCILSLIGRTNPSILNRLTRSGKRQLATDALYLDNVLEDLRLLDASEPNVQKFKSYLVM